MFTCLDISNKSLILILLILRWFEIFIKLKFVFFLISSFNFITKLSKLLFVFISHKYYSLHNSLSLSLSLSLTHSLTHSALSLSLSLSLTHSLTLLSLSLSLSLTLLSLSLSLSLPLCSLSLPPSLSSLSSLLCCMITILKTQPKPRKKEIIWKQRYQK